MRPRAQSSVRRPAAGGTRLATPGLLTLAVLLGALCYAGATALPGGPTADIAQVVHELSARAVATARAEDGRTLPGADSLSIAGARGEPVAKRGGGGRVERTREPPQLQPGREDPGHGPLAPLREACAAAHACATASLLPGVDHPACGARPADRLRRSRGAALHRMPRGPPSAVQIIRRR